MIYIGAFGGRHGSGITEATAQDTACRQCESELLDDSSQGHLYAL